LLPWDDFWQKFFVCANPQFHQLSRWLVSDECTWRSQIRRAGVIIHGLQLWGRLDVLPNSLKWLWRLLMVEKWPFNYLATALVDIPAIIMPIARSLKIWDICGIVLSDKTAHFRVAFYCTCVMIMLFNQLFDMPHLSGGWIIL
jgi:hypothetical protein